MKLLIALLAVAGLVLGSTAYANEEAAPAAKTEKAVEKAQRAPVAMEKIDFSGKLSKEEKTTTGKEGKEIKRATYKVTAADGTFALLPSPKKAKEGEAALDYDKFVDKDVKVSGEGLSKEIDGKKKIMLRSVTSIDLAPAQ